MINFLQKRAEQITRHNIVTSFEAEYRYSSLHRFECQRKREKTFLRDDELELARTKNFVLDLFILSVCHHLAWLASNYFDVASR